MTITLIFEIGDRVLRFSWHWHCSSLSISPWTTTTPSSSSPFVGLLFEYHFIGAIVGELSTGTVKTKD